MSNLDLIRGEVVEDNTNNREPVSIVAENTVLLLPKPLGHMNKHSLENYVQRMLLVEYEMKWGKKKCRVIIGQFGDCRKGF